jgi:hypothetical protein
MRQLFVRAMPVFLSAPVAVMVFVLPTLAGASPSGDRLDRLHQVRPDAAVAIPFPVSSDEFGLAPVDPNLVTGPAIEEPAPEPEPEPVVERVAAPSAPAPVVSAPRTGHCGADVACFLACTRAIESDSSGGYAAVSPDGQYHGAYQFLQATWDAAVAGAGFGEYIGVPAERVPPAVQDAAAAFLYSVRGNAPWGGRC